MQYMAHDFAAYSCRISRSARDRITLYTHLFQVGTRAGMVGRARDYPGSRAGISADPNSAFPECRGTS
jgi:hypothetical protein